MEATEIKELIGAAMAVRKNAYAPYSGFYVGAALMADDGTVFTGANCENASYPAGHCAERAALAAAVSAGKRRFRAVAIVGGKEDLESGLHVFVEAFEQTDGKGVLDLHVLRLVVD